MVESARLESVYTLIAYRGFESPSLRHFMSVLLVHFSRRAGKTTDSCRFVQVTLRIGSAARVTLVTSFLESNFWSGPMKKITVLPVATLLALLALSGQAHAGRSHVGISIDLGYFFPFGYIHSHHYKPYRNHYKPYRNHYKPYRHRYKPYYHHPRRGYSHGGYRQGYRHGYRHGYRQGYTSDTYGYRPKRHYYKHHGYRHNGYHYRHHYPRRHYHGSSYHHGHRNYGHAGITLRYHR